MRVFPPGFLWGAATAAHQVEGNNINKRSVGAGAWPTDLVCRTVARCMRSLSSLPRRHPNAGRRRCRSDMWLAFASSCGISELKRVQCFHRAFERVDGMRWSPRRMGESTGSDAELPGRMAPSTAFFARIMSSTGISISI